MVNFIVTFQTLLDLVAKSNVPNVVVPFILRMNGLNNYAFFFPEDRPDGPVAVLYYDMLSQQICLCRGFRADFDATTFEPYDFHDLLHVRWNMQGLEEVPQALREWLVNNNAMFISVAPPPEPIEQAILVAPQQDNPVSCQYHGYNDLTDMDIKEVKYFREVTYTSNRKFITPVVGVRKRNNIILHILEMAMEGVVAYGVIKEWFFYDRSIKETIRRLKRIQRYGFKLHLIKSPVSEKLFVLFRCPDGRHIDLQMAVDREYVNKIQKKWLEVDDGRYNENAHGHLICRYSDFDGRPEYFCVSQEDGWISTRSYATAIGSKHFDSIAKTLKFDYVENVEMRDFHSHVI